MNILHMRYAVEVARLGSLNKASETLLIAQPNISRSIKELEADLGIVIFKRSAKGMLLTPEGEEFIGYAKGILKQIDDVELLYKHGGQKKQKFSVSVPGASYISEAFAEFSKGVADGAAELSYKETSSQQTLQSVLGGECKLGIIRYAEGFERYFMALMEEKGLGHETLAEFPQLLTVRRDHPLTQKEVILQEDLAPFVEIAHAELYVPTLPYTRVVREELPEQTDRRIVIFERAGQMDLLAENPQTFMWASPASKRALKRYNLVQLSCADCHKLYKDVLIYREGYKLSKLDRQFLAALDSAKRKCF